MLLRFLPDFRPGYEGRLVVVGPTEGLRFCSEVLQCACQGDAKRRGFLLVLFTGPGASRAAEPCLRPSCHPANFFRGSVFVSSTPLGSLQDTNLSWSKFPFMFLCEPLLLRACVLDALVCDALAGTATGVVVTRCGCFVWFAGICGNCSSLTSFGMTKSKD